MARALEEKHRLVAEYYHLPLGDELNTGAVTTAAVTSTASIASGLGPPTSASPLGDVTSGGERDAREVLLAALVQGQFEVQQAEMLLYTMLYHRVES